MHKKVCPYTRAERPVEKSDLSFEDDIKMDLNKVGCESAD